MPNSYEIEPIGYFHAAEDEKYGVARQSGVIKGNLGKIVLNPKNNLKEALKDLEGFDRIFVIYRFHRNDSWKPKVMPPRGDKKRGVFATRSPHRPNFLGLSCLELGSIDGLTLHVMNHDLLDGTPIFDIKPYIPYADSFPEAKQGWLDELKDEKRFTIHWNDRSSSKLKFLQDKWNVPLETNIHSRLVLHPFPRKQNRIRDRGDGLYEIAYKTWRLSFNVDKDNGLVLIQDIYSGYDKETLKGEKACLYGDLDCHLDFLAQVLT